MDSKALDNCKNLNKKYICQETEPDQILNERAGCEVKLAANIPIQNFSQCEIKIIELDTTFCARLNNPNTWIFSAKGQEKMVVNYKRVADLNLYIKGSGILTLPAGCVARSDSVRLVATREIITNLTIQTFDEMPLDFSAILNDTNALVDNLVNVRMVGVSLKASTSTRLLKTGKDCGR